MSKHIVCVTCGRVLDCVWNGLGLIYNDKCKKSESGDHTAIEKECNCKDDIHLRGAEFGITNEERMRENTLEVDGS